MDYFVTGQGGAVGKRLMLYLERISDSQLRTAVRAAGAAAARTQMLYAHAARPHTSAEPGPAMSFGYRARRR